MFQRIFSVYETMVNPLWSQAFIDTILLAFSSDPGSALITTPTIRLFTAGPAPISAHSVCGDFTEAIFDGYAAVDWDFTLGQIVNLPSGQGRGFCPNSAVYVAGGAIGAGETILGYWITDAAKSILYAAEYFPAPIPLASPGDFIDLSILGPLSFVTQVSA